MVLVRIIGQRMVLAHTHDRSLTLAANASVVAVSVVVVRVI